MKRKINKIDKRMNERGTKAVRTKSQRILDHELSQMTEKDLMLLVKSKDDYKTEEETAGINRIIKNLKAKGIDFSDMGQKN